MTDNAAAGAKDAFGTSIGNARVGLCCGNDVRDFSPVTANTIRLEGLYVERLAATAGAATGVAIIPFWSRVDL